MTHSKMLRNHDWTLRKNQKLHDLGVSSTSSNNKRDENETTMEYPCQQMKKMQLMIAKLKNKSVPTSRNVNSIAGSARRPIVTHQNVPRDQVIVYNVHVVVNMDTVRRFYTPS